MDYIYTTFHTASLDGTPVLNPMWYLYPQDNATFGIDLQFFYGNSILVSPVTEENVTSVSIYLPNDRFYDFQTLEPVDGKGAIISLDNVDFTTIPLYIRGGVVLPLRENGTMTTTELRKEDFELVIAPGVDGHASGSLYIDDGVSVSPQATTSVTFEYVNGSLSVKGEFGFDAGVKIARVIVLDAQSAPKQAAVGNNGVALKYDATNGALAIEVDMPLTSGFEMHLTQ